MSASARIALVTGANRGVGLEVAKTLLKLGHYVLFSARRQDQEPTIRETLAKDGLEKNWAFCPLDVSQVESIEQCYQWVVKEHKGLDILINNAAIAIDSEEPYSPIAVDDPTNIEALYNTKKETLLKTFETNTVGVFLLCQRFIPLMQARGYGRVVNVSSQMGQLAAMGINWPAYRISKAALNAVTGIFARQTENNPDILVNAVTPGWVRSDMGGSTATRSLEEGADSIVWAATLPADGPSGGFFRDRQPIEW